MNRFRYILCLACALLAGTGAFAQSALKAILQDSVTGEPVGFATVSLTRQGAQKPAKYVLSDAEGKVEITNIFAGTYTVKAELLGYKSFENEVKIPDDKDLGTVKMDPDREQLDAASVSAVGNPIIIKKDTIEYNAASFKTTENDVLEDLLKKLPGVEVADDGSITINGQTIKKITIDGKTFFLDDPTLASKNIPAKIVDRLKVVEKKSDQAEFTGIDDGEEETIIDLSVKPGMMKGTFGNVMGGGGHDIKDATQYADGKNWKNDGWRYQGAAFVGNFTDKAQYSLIANVNNTNNRGFNDLAGSMMGGMMGGGGGFGGGRGGFGGGNGITTSYMAGLNGAWTLFDNRMDLGGNYVFNGTDKYIVEETSKTTYLSDHDMIYNSNGWSDTGTWGHRFGLRLDHKFSDNTSILFEPRINFGGGDYIQNNAYTTDYDYKTGSGVQHVNQGSTLNHGKNKNLSTSGFALLRQKLGKPGRTLTVMARYSYSNNDMDSKNLSDIYTDWDDATGNWKTTTPTRQRVDQNTQNMSLMGRATYTEPLADKWFLEANYGYTWNKSTSVKDTYDNPDTDPDPDNGSFLYTGGVKNDYYSSSVTNISNNQNIGANILYQTQSFRGQVGFSAIPTRTRNTTVRSGQTLAPYDTTMWRFAPTAMIFWEMGENANGRVFYRGSSNQPSVSQLIPVPDNSNPLSVSFGNPYLSPYFSHNLNGDFRLNNKKTFASVNVRFNASYVQDPIVNATWYGSNGAAYNMPLNGPDSFRAGLNIFSNLPLGQSGFTIGVMANGNFSQRSSFVGDDNVKDVIGNYYDATTGNMDYAGFLAAYHDGLFTFQENTTRTVTGMLRPRVTYRNDDLEITLSGRTRVNKSWYTIATSDNSLTFNNQVRAGVNWTWDEAGLTFKSDYNFNWYNGYSSSLNMEPEHILNAEIQKLLFKNTMTIALKGYDILGQAKNLSVTDNDNYHSEVINNTLGRYIILSITWRFGTFDRSKMRGPGGPGMGRGPMGPPLGR